jgi:hypothetical protein
MCAACRLVAYAQERERFRRTLCYIAAANQTPSDTWLIGASTVEALVLRLFHFTT